MKLPIKNQSRTREIVDQNRNNTIKQIDDLFQPLFSYHPSFGFDMMRPMRRIVDRVESWLPRTDVSETNKELKVAMDIPHVDPHNIDITVEEDVLVVNGKTEEEQEEKGKTWHQIERQYGEFHRAIDLPTGVESDKITANIKHGTLYITIPKKPEAQRKQIKIDIKE